MLLPMFAVSIRADEMLCDERSRAFLAHIRRGGALLLPMFAVSIRADEMLCDKRSRAFAHGCIARTACRHGRT